MVLLLCRMAAARIEEVGQSHLGELTRAEFAEHSTMAEAVAVDSAMEAMVQKFLTFGGKDGPRTRDMVKAGLGKVNLKAAAKRLESKLPSDVAGLVDVSVQD